MGGQRHGGEREAEERQVSTTGSDEVQGRIRLNHKSRLQKQRDGKRAQELTHMSKIGWSAHVILTC